MTCDSDIVTTISPILGTIVGGFIGYFVSVKVSDRKEFQKSAAEFHSAFLDAIMSLDSRYFSGDGGQSNVYDILNRTFREQIKAMLIFRLHLPKGKRHAFDGAWKEYCHYDIEGGPNYPFLEQYVENTWDGQSTKDLALQRINKLLKFSEDAPLLPFKLPFMG